MIFKEMNGIISQPQRKCEKKMGQKEQAVLHFSRSLFRAAVQIPWLLCLFLVVLAFTFVILLYYYANG